MVDKLEQRVEFVLIAKRGILEAQALLLCESIRRFAGAYSRAAITIVSSHGDRRPSAATLRQLERLDAEYLPADLAICAPEYGTAHRVHALAHIERRPGPALIVQLDSDAVFLGEPDLTESDAAARPVDVKGMCTSGPGDPFDQYWRELCALAGIDYEQLPFVETTIDRQRVRASYNGGFIVGPRDRGLFQRTEDIFRRLIERQMKTWPDGPRIETGTGVLQGAATVYWGTSQAAFSLAAVAAGCPVRILPATHNVPLHLLEQWPGRPPQPAVHIHYHGVFAIGATVPPFERKLGLAEETAAWLRERFPLTPFIYRPYRSASANPAQGGSVAARQAILVLGMHRSGTSATAGLLNAFGVAGPNTLLPADVFNPHGYWESVPLIRAHDRMLAAANSSWDDWRPIDPLWLGSDAASAYRDEIKAVVAQEFDKEPLIYLKDPRICRFVSFTASILGEIGFRPLAILILRNPVEVARSLKRREGMPAAKALLLWLRHVLDAEYQSRGMARCVLVYGRLLKDWRAEADRAARALGVIWPNASDEAAEEIANIIEPTLRHERVNDDAMRQLPGIARLVSDTYDAMLALSEDGDSAGRHARLDLLHAEFDSSCDLFGRATNADVQLISGLRSERDTHAKYLAEASATLESLAPALRQAVSERDQIAGALQHLTAEHDQIAAALCNVAAERDQIADALRNLTAEHDAISSALRDLNAESARLAAERDLITKQRNTAIADRQAVVVSRLEVLRQLETIRRSASWRLTAPLRVLRKMFSR